MNLIKKTPVIFFALANFLGYAQNTATPVSIAFDGDAMNVKTSTRGGFALVGGGGYVNGAFRWMIERSGGGDVVVITASGNTALNKAIYSIGGVNSVQTLNITSRAQADSDSVNTIIRNAEMIFIAGGDQSRYMNYWRGTKTQLALNYLLNQKKVPVGGTSAGCAILSGLYYSGESGSAVSDSVLRNPFHPDITLYNNDLLHAPFLKNVITDQHYLARKREGRHVAFLARIIHDWKIFPKGIAPDERTAVCIDDKGNAKVFGESKAYFLGTDKRKVPEKLKSKQNLEWVADKKALKVYEIQGSEDGAGSFSVKTFKPRKAHGGKWYWWWTSNGVLYKEWVGRGES